MAFVSPQSLLKVAKAGAPYVLDAAGRVIENKGSNSAQNVLVGGADAAMGDVNKAADTSVAGYKAAGAESRGAYDSNYQHSTGILKPYEETGLTGLTELNDPNSVANSKWDKTFSFDPSAITSDPGYQFRLNEGTRALQGNAAARGTIFSGAQVKALDRYSQEYGSNEYDKAYQRNKGEFDTAYDIFRNERTDRLANLKTRIGVGETATGRDIDAGNFRTTGISNTANTEASGVAGSEQLRAQQIADLKIQQANAIATGDVSRAEQIGGILKGIGGDLLQDQITKQILPAGVKTVASVGASAVAPVVNAASASGMAAGSAPSIAGLGAGALGITPVAAPLGGGALMAAPGSAASISGLGAGAAGITPTAPGTIVAGSAGGHSAAAAFMTNPWTIGIGAGILATTAILKSQAHWEANTLVKDVQTPFNKGLGQAHDAFFTAAEQGQLTPEAARSAIDQMKTQTADYLKKLDEFSKKGKDNKKVADQARAQMAKYYGDNFSHLIGDMESVYNTVSQQGAA